MRGCHLHCRVPGRVSGQSGLRACVFSHEERVKTFVLPWQTCGGLERAGEWATTPDGSAPRFLHSPETLAAAAARCGLCGGGRQGDGARARACPAACRASAQGLTPIMLTYTAKK